MLKGHFPRITHVRAAECKYWPWDTRFKSPGKLCMGKTSMTLSQVTWICLSPHWAQGVPLIDSKVVWRPLHDSLQLGIPRTSWS